jgi:glycosyltransferase involved in cell wall biosynthesis
MVSIIIPTLNEADNTSLLLESLLPLEGMELIVADGGSADATLEICRDFPVKVVSSPVGRGIQLNAGAKCARGEIFLFLHADSRIESQVLDG